MRSYSQSEALQSWAFGPTQLTEEASGPSFQEEVEQHEEFNLPERKEDPVTGINVSGTEEHSELSLVTRCDPSNLLLLPPMHSVEQKKFRAMPLIGKEGCSNRLGLQTENPITSRFENRNESSVCSSSSREDSSSSSSLSVKPATRKRGRPRLPESSLRCKLCHRVFTRRDNLRVHMRTHTGEKPFKCDKCGFSFRWISGIRTHRDSNRCRRNAMKRIDILRKPLEDCLRNMALGSGKTVPSASSQGTMSPFLSTESANSIPSRPIIQLVAVDNANQFQSVVAGRDIIQGGLDRKNDTSARTAASSPTNDQDMQTPIDVPGEDAFEIDTNSADKEDVTFQRREGGPFTFSDEDLF